RSADEIAVMRAIKAALDPGNLMNPHVLLPAD
ncbi:MAG: FAD-linked oxidase C-terminal domain-containing protein, partial [Actinomycetota bacterium]